MKTYIQASMVLTSLLAVVAVPAQAADRVRAGQWETSMEVAGRVMSRSACLTPDEADAMNGDAKSLRAVIDKVTAPSGCKVTDVKINGNQVSVASVCGTGKESVGTTTYHGDSFESVNTNGAKAQSKRVGACK